MGIIIFISLIITAISVIIDVEFGEDIPFDIRNKEFELTFQEAGALFISISFDTPNLLDLIVFFRRINFRIPVQPPGLGMVIPFESGATNTIVLQYGNLSNKKGIIWMNPSSKEINVNLNQTYEWKYDFKYTYSETVFFPYELKYSIENTEKDAILEFKYNNNFKVKEDLLAPNPLKICQKEQCKTNITTYDIKKGESYKIYIKTNIIETGTFQYLFCLPSFSFHFIYEEEEEKEVEEDEEEKEEKEKEKERKKEKAKTRESKYLSTTVIASFIIIGIILIIGIGLCCFLFGRKNAKKNMERYHGGNEHIELEEVRDNIEDNTEDIIV